MDKRIYRLFIALLIVSFGLSGCQTNLGKYSDSIKMYIYGNTKLSEREIDKIKKVTEVYSKYLFTVEGGIPTVKETDLVTIAPYESLKTWCQVYSSNQANAKLESFQLLDLYVVEANEVNCLCLCIAEYSDYKTPRGTYLFIVKIKLHKTEEKWSIILSEILGTGNYEDVLVLRDDITNEIKMVKKGGE